MIWAGITIAAIIAIIGLAWACDWIIDRIVEDDEDWLQ